ncbi:hypothetical protein F0Z19_5071 [Vibrio cyclitrophicus]|uniref:outer membrane beta-barrel protein n=1 Tax=unclassified Vibrio TaxID=2614977 RepID=UPI001281E82A|nr:hypothetical protein F0Z19_5071 [Vibrio cyclitrophicus]
MTKLLLSITVTTVLFCANAFSTEHDTRTNDSETSFGFYAGHVNSRNTNTNTNETNIGFGLEANYYFLPYLGISLGYGIAPDIYPNENFEHVDLQLKAKYPLSNYANLSLGVGNAHHFDLSNFDDVSDNRLMASVEVDYFLKPFLSFNVGYAYYDSPVSSHSSINSLNFGMRYHFGKNQTVADYQPTSIQTAIVEKKPTDVVMANKLKEEIPQIVEKEVIEKVIYCKLDNVPTTHIVKKDEWLLKIGKNYDMTIEKLIELNPSLSGSNLNLIYPGQRLSVIDKVKVCK